VTAAIETDCYAEQCVRLTFLQTCVHIRGPIYENVSRNLFYMCRKQGNAQHF